MKEIKAYIRLEKAEEVIEALESAGVPGLTVVEVKAMGETASPEGRRYSIKYAERYNPMVKLELVCRDVDVVRLVDTIRENAYTGHSGDGMIFVSEINYAIRIRTGEWGDSALTPG